jgi:Kef-type K+ transport system membrane component KefB
VVTTGVVAAIAVVLGLPWQQALAVGMILSLSSTAIALQSLERGQLETRAGRRPLPCCSFKTSP